MTQARPITAILAAITMAIAHAPAALAQDSQDGAGNHVPPGDPCGSGPGQGTGNPCNGNNGNVGNNGNAKTVYGVPPPFAVTRPEGAGSGAFIEQIGNQNSAAITQRSSSAYARIAQTGDDNIGRVEQTSSGDHYLNGEQIGNANRLDATQDGATGQVAIVIQTGDRNSAALEQRQGELANGVDVAQTGEDNMLAMLQDGSDNQALLTQEGDRNSMSAAQTGTGNRLIWTQRGDDISDLSITQSGSQAMSVTQTR